MSKSNLSHSHTQSPAIQQLSQQWTPTSFKAQRAKHGPGNTYEYYPNALLCVNPNNNYYAAKDSLSVLPRAQQELQCAMQPPLPRALVMSSALVHKEAQTAISRVQALGSQATRGLVVVPAASNDCRYACMCLCE